MFWNLWKFLVRCHLFSGIQNLQTHFVPPYFLYAPVTFCPDNLASGMWCKCHNYLQYTEARYTLQSLQEAQGEKTSGDHWLIDQVGHNLRRFFHTGFKKVHPIVEETIPAIIQQVVPKVFGPTHTSAMSLCNLKLMYFLYS